jgi:hypothetical protein
VAPKLRVAVAPDMRDWRQHLEAAHAHMGTLAAAWPDARYLPRDALRHAQLCKHVPDLAMRYSLDNKEWPS